MFVTMSAHVAAMAPGTNIGATHPLGLGQTADEVMTEKVVRNAAAFARSVASTRGRNASSADKAVIESASISADEALERNVIDFVVNDLGALLRRLDGHSIDMNGQELTLTTTDAARREHPMTLPERIIHALTNPNVAYLLFTCGVSQSTKLLLPVELRILLQTFTGHVAAAASEGRPVRSL